MDWPCGLPQEIWLKILKPLACHSCYAVLKRTCRAFHEKLAIRSEEDYNNFGFDDHIEISLKESMDHSFDSYWYRSLRGKRLNKRIEAPHEWEYALKTVMYFQDRTWRNERYRAITERKKSPQIRFDGFQITRVEWSFQCDYKNDYSLDLDCIVDNHKPEFGRTQAFIHWTFDGWKTVKVEPLEYQSRWHEKSYWRWTIADIARDDPKYPEIWFAVTVKDTWEGTEHWDNNGGWNYRFLRHSYVILPIITESRTF
jgi:hypothetical protein